METPPPLPGSNPFPPPPPLTPPPVIAPPPPPKAKPSWGWIILSLVLLALFGFAVLVIFTQSVSRSLSFHHSFTPALATEAGPKLDEILLEDNHSRNKIAVITVDGIITSHTEDGMGNDMVDVLKAQLQRAAEDDRVKAVILKVDSPGGEVMASDQIAKAIENFQTDWPAEHGKPALKGKPIICSMGSLAASGGYYISAPCRWIVADELTLTGSIGVIMHGWNYRGLMDKVGLAPMTYKSGKFKDMLSPDRATNDIPVEERAMVQALIDETYGKFKTVVADGRNAAHDLNKKNGRALSADWEDVADGRILSGTQAFEAGLVDELGDFDTAVDRALSIVNLKNANLVEYRVRYDFANFLSMFGQGASAKDIKLDLGVEIPKLRPGCMYFLWLMPGS